MNEHQKLAVRAIECYMGDDYARASHEFGQMTEYQLDRQYGQSGQTCREIWEGYRRKRDACQAAIEWVKAQM